MIFGTANGDYASIVWSLVDCLPRAVLRTIRLLFSYLANALCDGIFMLCDSKIQKIGVPHLDILFPEVIILNFFDDTKYT